MKIAILTLPLHFNYGGNLQCYALTHVLKDMGHEAINIRLIQEVQLPPLKQRPYLYFKRFVNKILGRKYSCVFAEQKLIRDRNVVQKHADEFIRKYIPQTSGAYKNANSLKGLNQYHFDAFIVGSDQVWRPKYAYPDIRSYYLDFLEDDSALRISYAASFGTDQNEYSEQEAEDCGALLKKFDALSVREASAIHLIQNVFKWDCRTHPQLVLDPTLLLEKEDYIQMTARIPEKNYKGKLFYYILDMTPDKKQSIDMICRMKHLECFTVFPKSTSPGGKVEDKIIPPVEEWIEGFREAGSILTDSFHGCVFSILFNKPFIVYANPKRGFARFQSLLTLFGLQDRLVTTSAKLQKKDMDSPIDWTYVNSIRKKMKRESLSFLRDALTTRETPGCIHTIGSTSSPTETLSTTRIS